MSHRRQRGEEIRGQIVAAASTLFQKRGFGEASFLDLARESGVPKGNFYHYFRSKDDVLEAVIADRLGRIEAQLRELEEGSPDPLRRIAAFLQSLTSDATDPFVFGCPHGSLCAELAKARPDLLTRAAQTLDRLRRWFGEQFRRSGTSGNPNHLALRLLARIQGIILVGATFRDGTFVRREIREAEDWLDSLRPPAPVRGSKQPRP